MSEKRHTTGPWNVSPVVNHDGPGTCQGITDSEGVVVARFDVWADSCADEVDGIIPLSWIEKAIERGYEASKSGELGRVTSVGVDVAGGGKDSTVLAPCYGMHVGDLIKISADSFGPLAGRARNSLPQGDAIEAENYFAEIVLLGLIQEAAQLAEKINAASRAAFASTHATRLADDVEGLAVGYSIEAAVFGREAIAAAEAAGVI